MDLDEIMDRATRLMGYADEREPGDAAPEGARDVVDQPTEEFDVVSSFDEDDGRSPGRASA